MSKGWVGAARSIAYAYPRHGLPQFSGVPRLLVTTPLPPTTQTMTRTVVAVAVAVVCLRVYLAMGHWRRGIY